MHLIEDFSEDWSQYLSNYIDVRTRDHGSKSECKQRKYKITNQNALPLHENFVIFYDKPIHLGRFIERGAIKSDIVMWNRKAKTAQIIEVLVPNDYGLNRTERGNTNIRTSKIDLRMSTSQLQ